MGITDSLNKLVGKTIKSVDVIAINSALIETQCGESYSIETVVTNPLGFSSIKVTPLPGNKVIKNWDKLLKFATEAAVDYTDNKTGEVDYTALAEHVACIFDIYDEDNDYSIPEELFDLVLQVDSEDCDIEDQD